MKKIHLHFFNFFVWAGILIVLCPCSAFAETCEKWVAKVVSVQGSVEVRGVGETEWRQVKLNDTYCTGDMIRVQEKSRADIALVNHPVLRLDQNTTITLGGLKEGGTSVVDLIRGAAHFFSRVARNLNVQTAFVNAGVEGTEFFIRVDSNSTILTVFEGKVLASNREGSLAVSGGQSAKAEAGKAPAPYIMVRPRDAVQWALYYPPTVYYRPGDFQGGGWQADVRESLRYYMKRDFTGAFSALEKALPDISDPRFYIYRSSLLLEVGRVDEARKDIERALAIDSNNSQAFALKAVIAVVQNDKEGALSLAKKAVDANPNSASALVALSYAQQANFDLKGALNSLVEAVKVEPKNALVWSRLAEMRMSLGELDEALKAANKAVELNPDVARTQTVLGFAYLTEVKIKQSEEVFEKAIGLDNAAPLPRLGLGLAKIRDGDLEEGRKEIEIAASLDPNNALMRSYLGKAYYEEKRDKQASEEYNVAEGLDPSDPTSFFYAAIMKQTENRPVEALHDMQKAIDLNDNRAVYRSELLLDSDLAARSASLARIYSDLGFQDLALVEGWKSVNTDPADFSGHRFLADSYSALPRHEIARVSELLQSQLLQPINITPIQPRLAESNLFILSGAGPEALSFNEFNPLFNRNRVALQADGIVGVNSTFGDEVVASGIYNNVSFSAGQYHYQTDGFRTNDDLKDNILNAFVQVELSPETSVQAEYRYRDTERGDLQLRFFPNDFLPGQRQEDKTNSVRLGFHHAFSPGSDLLGSFMYQHADRILLDNKPVDPVVRLFDLKGDDDAYSAELQQLFSLGHTKLILGSGYFGIPSKDNLNLKLLFPGDVIPTQIRSVEDFDTHHTNLYTYSLINILKNVTFTAGGSADFFESEDGNRNQFNPKFGVTWNPVPETTLRAAVFRELKRTLITNQTLEPTQVAGFNQFYDDLNATDSWHYGIAVDQKFSKNMYAGAEYSFRDLEVPFISLDPPFEQERVDWNEHTGRFYFYWTPHVWLAFSAEYLFERFERAKEFSQGAKEIETHRVPLGVNFNHPSGLSAMLTATYYNQHGDFERLNAPSGFFVSGKDQFWLFDAAVRYRLPKRLGFITVGAKNLFDKSFKYYDSDPVSPAIQPDRFVYMRLTLAI